MKTIKTIVTILLVCITAQANAWNEKVIGNGKVVTINRTTSDYEKVIVGGNFDVTLIKGSEGKLTIEIEDNLDEYLETKIEYGNLKIKWKKGYNIKTRKGVKITVPFKEIDGVTLAGSGKIKSEDTIESDELIITLAGSGTLKVDVEANTVQSKVAGSGNIVVSGKTDELNCKIAGSGNFKGYDLTTNDANTKIAGSGSIYATINGNLNAKIAGSGNVRYKGNPTREKVKIAGSGNVSKR